MNKNGENGFTLLEVIIAFVILTVSFSALYQSVGTNLSHQDRYLQERVALMQAQNILNSIPLVVNSEETSSEGTTENGFEWRVELTPYEESESIVRLLITVYSGENGHAKVEVSSLRMRTDG